MEFPEEIVAIIKEYTRPLTRPDWKKLKKLTVETYLVNLYNLARYRYKQLFMTTFQKVCSLLKDKIKSRTKPRTKLVHKRMIY